jgi:hypothetical protein
VQTAEVEAAVGEAVEAGAEMAEEGAVAAGVMAVMLPVLVTVATVEAAETAEPAMRVPPRVAEAALPETLVEEPEVVEEAAEVVARAERSARYCGPREVYRESSILYQ